MAADFEISPQYSGQGSATIRVKPKSVNTSGSTRSQVLRVTVKGVEREVTLIQKSGTAPVVTNEYVFKFADKTTTTETIEYVFKFVE